MAEDYYPNPESDSSSESGAVGGDTKDKRSMDAESETTLIPSSMFGGKEPEIGQEYIFKVEHIYENEVEVSYSKGSEKDNGESDTPDAAFGKHFNMMEA